jgi:hypothetical protein
MKFELYRPVRLLSDDYRREGVGFGAIGVVIEDYGDAYEVEFSREDGTTIAWFAVGPDEIEPVQEDSRAPAPGSRSGRSGDPEEARSIPAPG